MTDPVQAAIAAAQAKAAETSTAVAVQPQTSTAVGAPAMPAQKLSMDNMMSGMVVDKWIKVKDTGLLVGDNRELLSEIIVEMDMTEGQGFIPKMGIKAGNPAQYFYTTDNATCQTGGSWEAACNKARNIDQKASPYRCVDLPFKLINDLVVKDKAGKDVTLAEAGTMLGYTTSTTNWGNWQAFYKEVANAGLLGQKVEVKLGYQYRSNKNGNEWGVMTFALIGAVEESE